MNQFMDSTRELVITNISLSPDGLVEIAYAEKREQGDHAGIMRQLVIDSKGAKCRDEVDELVQLAMDIVDLGLHSIRNPEERIDPRDRLKKRQPRPEPDDDANEDE